MFIAQPAISCLVQSCVGVKETRMMLQTLAFLIGYKIAPNGAQHILNEGRVAHNLDKCFAKFKHVHVTNSYK